uniref:mitogen-activated protein kinase kinase n=1 Tax=Panagrolaimus superbus TaxID=310955 RepID=A0A914XVE2_9BILA
METMAMCMETLCQNYIKPNEMNIPECILGKITVAIVEALRYLKNVHGLIHRDIKPSNILIDWDGLIKLADFGVSGSINNVSSPDIPIHGCIQYCPPGVLDHRKQDQSEFDERYDIWGLRISLYEMATLKPAYNFIDNILFELSIINDTVPPLPKKFFIKFSKIY